MIVDNPKIRISGLRAHKWLPKYLIEIDSN
jgi:hypothetical protein